MSSRVEKISDYYSRLHSLHGDRPEASDYGSEESQATKFRVLSEVGSYENKSVLDVGCGFAKFSSYLTDQFGDHNYHGVDICADVIESASKKLPDLKLECRDVLTDPPGEKYDLVTANGIFYLVEDDPKGFFQEMIKCMFSLCDEAVAVNTLSTWADFCNETEFYADPVETLAFCKTLTNRVVLRHDYMNHDFTLYLYK